MKFIIIGLIFVAITGVGAFLILQEPSDSSSDSSTKSSSSSVKQDDRTDVQFKNDTAKAVSMMNAYQANNNGRLPEDANVLYEEKYFDADYVNPLTEQPYEFVSSLRSVGEIEYRNGYECSGEDAVTGSSRFAFTMRIMLTDESVYCLDNS